MIYLTAGKQRSKKRIHIYKKIESKFNIFNFDLIPPAVNTLPTVVTLVRFCYKLPSTVLAEVVLLTIVLLAISFCHDLRVGESY
jgi:hypothetical protein